LISATVLIRSTHGEFDLVVERIGKIKGVMRIFPVLGRYDVVVDIEASNSTSLGTAVLRMNRMSGVVFTETLVEVLEEEN
jgi:uncharacterized protein with GYD domain